MENAEFELVEVDVRAHEKVVETRNPNSIVHSDYITTGTHHVQVKFEENPSGIHGTGSITGPIYIEVEFDAACITEVDNRATIGGLVTFLELGDNPFGFPVQVGWYIYMAMEDNGEGKKGPTDKYHGEVYFGMPAFGPLCDVLEPFHPIFWMADDWNDVQGKNDKVVIR